MRFRIAALAASAAVIGALAIPAAAQAAPTRHNPAPQVVNGYTKGLAGYYENQRSDWRYRDVRASFTVTAEMEELNNLGTFGRTGVWQCNPNTGTAVQSGIEWNGTSFEAVYGTGTLTGGPDPCVTGGLLAPVEFPGNITNSIAINIGDTVEFEQYYNTATRWETLTAIDVTQNAQSAVSFYEGYPNFYEAGVGVVDECAPNLVNPVANFVTQFSSVRVTTYNSKHPGTSLNNGHDTEMVTGFNTSNVAVLIPTALSGGSSFAVNAGVSSPAV